MKIAINKCYGGFNLSKKAIDLLSDYLDEDEDVDRLKRSDKRLVDVIESLGKEASGTYGKIKIFNIPDAATDYRIDDYDGLETVTYVVDGKIHTDWED